MKIVYVYSTFATTGGTERIIIEKANYLAEHFGYDVTLLTCFQHTYEQNFFKTSEKLKQIFLEIPYYSQYKYKYPKRLWVKWKLNRRLQNSISQSVEQLDPDILIGILRFKANYVSRIKCRAKKIIECHVVRYDTLYDAGENRSFPVRSFLKIYEYIYLRTIERNADLIITLTEKDKLLWKRAKHTIVIPNFSVMTVSRLSDCTPKRVIAVGHLVWGKGFARLIEIWSIVYVKHPDWHLDFYGEGDMYNTLNKLIQIYKTKNVTFHNVTPDISQEYASSSICAVTSYFEGFSLVILESMRHGVPCVAFDCPFGPGSLINDASSGFIVDDGDIRRFADRLCRLIEDINLRKQFSQNSIERAKLFNVDKIMNRWKDIFEDLCAELDSRQLPK